jgi:hypothetical protein
MMTTKIIVMRMNDKTSGNARDALYDAAARSPSERFSATGAKNAERDV